MTTVEAQNALFHACAKITWSIHWLAGAGVETPNPGTEFRKQLSTLVWKINVLYFGHKSQLFVSARLRYEFVILQGGYVIFLMICFTRFENEE